MTEVSNRTVAALLFVAMAVTVFSTAITLNKLNVLEGGGLTGFATSPNATAKLNISQTTSIKFTNAVIDWSNGTVNTSGGNVQCNLTTNGWTPSVGYQGCVGFATTHPGDLVLENDGNQNASIDLRLDPSSSDVWIGGNNAYSETYAEARNNEGGSCATGLVSSSTILTTSDNTYCTNLQYDDPTDTINISLMVSIPSDAPVGQKTTDIVATATGV